MPLIFQPRQKLLFIGDSITDCGRRGADAPYGWGYVRAIYELLGAAYPGLNLTIVNKGVSGHTSRDLAGRWERDAIAEQPDWLFIKIGVNDMWRFMTGQFDAAVTVGEFEVNYRIMLERSRAATRAGLILIEPFLAVSDPAAPFRSGLDQYRVVVRQLAQEYQTRLVKLQDAFDRGLQSRPMPYWAEDGVHPTRIGHVLIAREVLKVCGYEF